MTVYHLHARLFKGDLGAPIRNELQSRETNDRAEIKAMAKELAARGFTVWIYDHGHREALPGASDYRTIATYLPNGQVEHTGH